jgi:GTP diphosphokinase / guanosine-3',5'-bis(diphosphate) 3'-diphosphatase
MNFESLLDVLPSTYNVIDRELIQRAYRFAEKAHSGQKRASGEAYITHCIEVAAILAEMSVPPIVVIAGLLHDTPMISGLDPKTIRTEFGDEVLKLVEGVSKLMQIPNMTQSRVSSEVDISSSDQMAASAQMASESVVEVNRKSRNKDLKIESIRNTFIAMGEDVRVILIKLADRLHNMRTLSYLPEESRLRASRETLDIFAPLANRLGLWRIKWELEDLAFRYVDPQKYKEIAEKLAVSRESREKEIEQIIELLTSLLKNSGITASISGRPKHIYSIYKKMEEKGKPFEMVRDLRGVRLQVKDIPTCYAALGVIHTHWRPIPQEFDDYIAAPKDNFYQSIHTAVIYDDGKPLEVQIRTFDMHQNAEYGIAAHWRYKEDGKRDDSYQQRLTWLRKLMDWRQDIEDTQDFSEEMRADVFEDRVYAFTPRGDIIDLPAGSTPLDFAYHVHTQIGNRCRGAKVNGKLVTLDYTLKTGDQVEILTAKQGGPSRDWLNKNLGLVKTQRARAKIKQWFKKQDYDQNVSQGKAILERELHRLGIADIDLQSIQSAFEYKSLEDLYAALGSGDLSFQRIINLISEEAKEKDPLLTIHPQSEIKSTDNAVTVLGLKGILTSIARCCNPAPGDQIVGYITRGRGVTIHRDDCPNILLNEEKERLIKVSWGQPQQTYPVSIQVKGYDRQGLMGDISTVFSNENVNLIDINMKISHNLANFNLVIEVKDITQLSRILTRIENLPNILEAHRIKPG